MFPKRYANGEDLHGKSFTLEIAHITREEMTNIKTHKTESKFVVYFFKNKTTGEITKGFVLGKEFAESIAVALDESNADKWAGRRVEIFPQQTRLGIGVRARRAPNGTTMPPAQINDDEDEMDAEEYGSVPSREQDEADDQSNR
jgi:hypothetical protein